MVVPVYVPDFVEVVVLTLYDACTLAGRLLMVPEKPALVPEIPVTVPSGEVMLEFRLAERVEPLPLARFTLLGPKELAVPLAKLLGFPVMLQVTFSVLVPGLAVTAGLVQVTTVCTGTFRVMVALLLPLSAWAVFKTA